VFIKLQTKSLYYKIAVYLGMIKIWSRIPDVSAVV